MVTSTVNKRQGQSFTTSLIPGISRENPLLTVLRAISEETRLRILHILSFGDFSVNEIVEILSMGQSSVSRHLKILTDAGILGYHREGSLVYYGHRADRQPFHEDLIPLLLSYKEDVPYREEDQRNVNLLLEKREKLSRSFFDDMGLTWESVQEEVLDPRIYRDRILQALPEDSGLVLDLGCGPGGLIPYLLSKSERVIGLDSSPKMVEVSRREFKGNPRVQIHEAHLENLPMQSEEADSVVSSMVLHHLSHPPKMLGEVARVLKPGGIFTLVDLNKHNQEFMREKYADLWMGFEPDLVRTWMYNFGFEILEEEIISTKSVFKLIFIKARKKED